MSVLAGAAAGDWIVESMDVSPEEMQERVTGWVSEQEAMRSRVVERVRAQRQQVRKLGNWGQLSLFTVGNYVLVARVRKLVSSPKLVPTWTGP